MLDESLLDKNRKYLVGVSGGVDSMALLDMLVKKAYNVIVVHYNYHFEKIVILMKISYVVIVKIISSFLCKTRR